MLKVGIVGSGLMGKTHAAAWAHTSATLAGVYSVDGERAATLASEYQTQSFSDLDALLKQVDVVDICTPTHAHHSVAIRAAEAGKHVVCEKPLARTHQQGREMIAACEKAGVQLLVAHVVRFFPEYARTKAVVERGDIGRVAVVRLTRCSALPVWATDNWLMDSEKSGGMMLDLMVHDFDYARWVAGDVESVYARSVRGQNPGAREDYGLVILQHRNGAISNVEGGWAYPQGMFRTALEVAGDAGLVEHPAGSSAPLGIHLKEQAGSANVVVPRSPLIEDPYTTEIKHFYDVLVHGVEPRVTAVDGLAALEIGLAAIESARSGRRVRIEEVQ